MDATVFRASFCDPFKQDIVEMGNIAKDKIMELFESIPWQEYLAKMDTAKENEIYYSPSLEVENAENHHGITISAVDDREWYVFFKRPKRVRKFFGLIEKTDDNYLTELHVSTKAEASRCLEALIRNDLHFLETTIG